MTVVVLVLLGDVINTKKQATTVTQSCWRAVVCHSSLYFPPALLLLLPRDSPAPPRPPPADALGFPLGSFRPTSSSRSTTTILAVGAPRRPVT